MTRIDGRTSKKTGMAAFALTVPILFVLTAGAVEPLQAQADSVSMQVPGVTVASWSQTGYNAAHVGYNP